MQKLLNRLRIRAKLYTIVLVAIIAIISIQLISLNQYWSELKENKYNELDNVTVLAVSIIQEQYRQVVAGIKTTEKAQHDAKTLINAMTYSNDGYLFIIDNNYRILTHPLKPQLIGTVQENLTDENGIKLFKNLVDGSISNGVTRVEYMWPLPNTNTIATKFSVARYDSQWKWAIGTGAYIEDLKESFISEIWFKIEETVIVLVLMMLVAVSCAKSIIKPIDTLKQGMIDVSETKNLTLRVKLDSEDELSEMGHAFDEMLNNFEKILTELHLSSSQLAATSVELSGTTSQTMIGMENQTEQTRLVATAMAEMSNTVIDIGNSTNEAAIASNEASLATTEGQLIVDESLKSVIDLSEKLQKAGELTQNLEQQSTAISTILEVISGIAEQTNLLALNAAIEAARAGEQGRGFAVVADEVRNLSSRTHQSTNEITDVISSLQEGSLAAASAMKESKEAVDNVESQSLKVQRALGVITTSVEKIDLMTTNIAGASEEQSKVAEKINNNIVNISEVTEQSSASSVQVDSASNELSTLSCRLQDISQQFILTEKPT